MLLICKLGLEEFFIQQGRPSQELIHMLHMKQNWVVLFLHFEIISNSCIFSHRSVVLFTQELIGPSLT